jgi:hypothetical protein
MVAWLVEGIRNQILSKRNTGSHRHQKAGKKREIFGAFFQASLLEWIGRFDGKTGRVARKCGNIGGIDFDLGYESAYRENLSLCYNMSHVFKENLS